MHRSSPSSAATQSCTSPCARTWTRHSTGVTGGAPPVTPVECRVQVRAHGEVHDCVAALDGDDLCISLRTAARGVAAGQAAVLYRGDTVLGSATIAATR